MSVMRPGYRLLEWASTKAYKGMAACRLLILPFPADIAYVSVLICLPGAIIAYWSLQMAQVRGHLDLPSGVPTLDPAILLFVSLLVFSVYVLTLRGGRSGHVVGGAFVFFTIVVLAFSWLYANNVVVVALGNKTVSVPDHYWLTKHMPGLLDGESGPSSLLVGQLVLTQITMAIRYGGHKRRIRRRLVLAALATMSTISVISLLATYASLSDVAISVSLAAVVSTVSLVLPFHASSVTYMRSMADAIAGFIIFVVLMFYFTQDPARLIWGSTPVLAVFAVILFFDNWFNPRLAAGDRGQSKSV